MRETYVFLYTLWCPISVSILKIHSYLISFEDRMNVEQILTSAIVEIP
jgi:hypothetical protein